MEISGKVMLVTGASSGIGAATARAASKAGARLVIAARRQGLLEELRADLGDALAVVTDMRDPAQVWRLVETAVDQYGGVDILVNNAGQGLHVPVEQIRLEDLAAIMELNVYGALAAMQAVIPVMRTRGAGSIINVSSGTTRMPSPAGASA